MNKKLLLIIIAILLITPMVIGTDMDIYKKGNRVDLKTICEDAGNNFCAGACSISVLYPNNTLYVDSGKMSISGNFFNYTLDNSEVIGEYKSFINCSDTLNSGSTKFNFLISYTGEQPPNDIIKSVFSILFIVLFAWFIFTTFNVVAHFLKTDADLTDLAYSWIGYFILLIFYRFSLDYWGNSTAIEFMQLFIKIGAWTHGFLPAVAFIVSLIMGMLRRRKLQRGY